MVLETRHLKLLGVGRAPSSDGAQGQAANSSSSWSWWHPRASRLSPPWWNKWWWTSLARTFYYLGPRWQNWLREKDWEEEMCRLGWALTFPKPLAVPFSSFSVSCLWVEMWVLNCSCCHALVLPTWSPTLWSSKPDFTFSLINFFAIVFCD